MGFVGSGGGTVSSPRGTPVTMWSTQTSPGSSSTGLFSKPVTTTTPRASPLAIFSSRRRSRSALSSSTCAAISSTVRMRLRLAHGIDQHRLRLKLNRFHFGLVTFNQLLQPIVRQFLKLRVFDGVILIQHRPDKLQQRAVACRDFELAPQLGSSIFLGCWLPHLVPNKGVRHLIDIGIKAVARSFGTAGVAISITGLELMNWRGIRHSVVPSFTSTG